MQHVPVLQREVLKYLDPSPNENFVDCTLGEAGHALLILGRNVPDGRVLGIELDPELYKRFQQKAWTSGTQNRLIAVNDSYKHLRKIVKRYNFGPISGILFDLGLCAWHIQQSKRGFSFLRDESLDMRYNPITQSLKAEDILNQWPQSRIEKILFEYGQERFSKRIAKEIVKQRQAKPIKTTFVLKKVIQRAVPRRARHRRIHLATRVFQALRIAVNNELENLKISLPQAIEVMEPGARLVVISFHSLEDSIVKNFFKILAKEKRAKILTKKPVQPSWQEIKRNSSSRSAKLRAIIKL